MIINEHIKDYIASLDSDESTELLMLEKWALENEVPIIRHDTQQFLKFCLIKNKPKAILEIGTAVGFSTLFMHEYAPSDAEITTIEKVEMRLVHARKNLAGVGGINLIEGDAGEVLKALAAKNSDNRYLNSDEPRTGELKFDMIFLDAAKGQYLNWLDDILKLMKPGSLLLTDNVLLEGTIAESKFAIPRRDRTIHMRMRDFLYEITHNDMLVTDVLPIGDGLAVSYFNNGR